MALYNAESKETENPQGSLFFGKGWLDVTYPYTVRLTKEHVGRQKLVLKRTYKGKNITEVEVTVFVVSGCLDHYDILCSYHSCSDNEIVPVGSLITLYFDYGWMDGEKRRTVTKYEVNLPSPGWHLEELYDFSYNLTSSDLGRKFIKYDITLDNSALVTVKRNITVVPDSESLFAVNILCNGVACKDKQTMKFGDEISCYKVPLYETKVSLKSNNLLIRDVYPCVYTLREEDVGTKSFSCVAARSADISHKDRSINVVCDYRDKDVLKPLKKNYEHTAYELKVGMDGVVYRSSVIIVCGYEPCDKPGRTIYTGTYISCLMKDGQRVELKFMINDTLISWRTPVFLSEISYKLKDNDIGLTTAICSASDTAFINDTVVSFRVLKWPCPDDVEPTTADLFGQPVTIDIMCNGKVCQANESMMFGDKISCHFEPRFMIDWLTFNLNIDGIDVEGSPCAYPCTRTWREEDVGTKLVKCRSQDSQEAARLYESGQMITIVCANRDPFVVRPNFLMYDEIPYVLKFKMANTTFKLDIIILCGGEPCDKPGRTIYVGTYVTCRMNDGQRAGLYFMVNGRLVSKQLPIFLSSISYQLKPKDNGSIMAICSANGTNVLFNLETVVHFTVFKWPCSPEAKPAMADVFEDENTADEIDFHGSTASLEHGDAAGAIDVDQAENIGSGPAAGDKGITKWNDGMAAEKADEDGKPKPNSGNGQGSFVFLQLFLAFIAAYVGIGQF